MSQIWQNIDILNRDTRVHLNSLNANLVYCCLVDLIFVHWVGIIQVVVHYLFALLFAVKLCTCLVELDKK